MTATTNPSARRDHKTDLQRATMLVGGAFLLIGILGFIPGITSNFDDMSFAGHESEAKLLGLFQTSVLHNLVHLAFGVAGIVAARRVSTSRSYLIGGGLVYLLLTVYGLLVGNHSDANFVPLNVADDLLHLGLGLGMVGLGVALSKRDDARRSLGSNRATS